MRNSIDRESSRKRLTALIESEAPKLPFHNPSMRDLTRVANYQLEASCRLAEPTERSRSRSRSKTPVKDSRQVKSIRKSMPIDRDSLPFKRTFAPVVNVN